MFNLFLGAAIRTGAVALTLLAGGQMLQAQWYPQSGNYQRQPASPADRTVEDLRQVAQRNAFTHGERERFDHAIEHLSQFSGRLYGGRFDRSKLDRSIDDMRTVLQRNRIDPRGREILSNDLNELMRYRSSYGGYRY
jgi:muramidase (phage lysozyme)